MTRVPCRDPVLTQHSALSTLKLEHLQPIITRIHCDHTPGLVEGDGPGVAELARVAAAGAPDAEAAAGFLVDELQAVVAELTDDEPASAVEVEAEGPAELA